MLISLYAYMSMHQCSALKLSIGYPQLFRYTVKLSTGYPQMQVGEAVWVPITTPIKLTYQVTIKHSLRLSSLSSTVYPSRNVKNCKVACKVEKLCYISIIATKPSKVHHHETRHYLYDSHYPSVCPNRRYARIWFLIHHRTNNRGTSSCKLSILTSLAK